MCGPSINQLWKSLKMHDVVHAIELWICQWEPWQMLVPELHNFDSNVWCLKLLYYHTYNYMHNICKFIYCIFLYISALCCTSRYCVFPHLCVVCVSVQLEHVTEQLEVVTGGTDKSTKVQKLNSRSCKRCIRTAKYIPLINTVFSSSLKNHNASP